MVKKIENTKSTPKGLGYRMPAEWEPQSAIWLAWPHNDDTFESFLPEVRQIFTDFIAALAPGQRINLVVNRSAFKKEAEEMLQKSKVDLNQVTFYPTPNVDVWFRDFGPTFVVKQGAPAPLAMVKWIFNAWGNKYDDLKLDNQIPYDLNEKLHLPIFEPGIVLEGGSIDVNGQGTVLTTEQCLLNKNRNSHLTREQIEEYLHQYLNVEKVIWLKEGIAGDDTDGHVDDIARFVNHNTVICAFEENAEDENAAPLRENYNILTHMSNAAGEPLNVVKIPMPDPVILEAKRYPASYANFYIGNTAVVVPIFGHSNDKKALQILQDLFPTRKVVGINCTVLVYGYGTLHCSSQQQPKA